MRKNRLVGSLVVAFLFFGYAIPVFSSSLEDGIIQYQRENYDEALELFQAARKEDPASTRSAYYLGLTYKRLQKYPEAKDQLLTAVTSEPKIREALLDLVEVLYQLGDTAGSKKWIEAAEAEGIRPGQTAFLKGLAQLKEGDSLVAIESFQKAKSLDKQLSQACDYQIGLAHLKSQSLSEAQKAFSDVALLDPNTDIARYADEYRKAIDRLGETGRPFRVSAGIFYEFDDNVILKPGDSIAVSNVDNEDDTREVVTLSAEYSNRCTKFYGIKLQYGLYYANQDNLDNFDLHSHTWTALSSFYLDKAVINVPLQYNYTWVDGDGFLSTFTTGPDMTFRINEQQLGQVFLKIQDKEYRNDSSVGVENRDAVRWAPGASWYYFFGKNKNILNLRYEFDQDLADGSNWEYNGNRFLATIQLPVFERLNLTFAGDYYFQDYNNTNTIFNTKREDESYTLSTLLSYKIWKEAELQFRYTYVHHDSNITVYDYDRNVFSTGLVVKF